MFGLGSSSIVCFFLSFPQQGIDISKSTKLVEHQEDMLCFLFHWALFVSLLQNANTKEKSQTPSEKMSQKPSPSQGAEAARKKDAVAAADSPKNKKDQKNQKSVEKVKER